jgi:hypothetical protein
LKNFIVVSFYTKNTYYEEEIKTLIESCQKLQTPIETEGLDCKGSWNANCHIKPLFILKQLKKHNKPILWIDADAIVCSPLDFFNEITEDVAVRIEEDLPEDHPYKVISATVYIKPSKEGIELLEKWCEISNKRSYELTDEAALREALFEQKGKVKVRSLPTSFCSIIDLEKDIKTTQKPVIAQTQASRLYQKIIDKELPNMPFLTHLDHKELKKLRHPNIIFEDTDSN